MDLTVNPEVDLSETTTVTLGGAEFRLAPLVLRQTRRIGPMLPEVLAVMNRRAIALASWRVKENGDPDMTPDEMTDVMRRAALTEAESDMFLAFIHAGLARVYPRLALDGLLDLPITTEALLEAANAVGAASGLVRKAPAAGEQVAASQ